MGFYQSIKSVYTKYFFYSGRASRSEYWWFLLFTFLGSMFLAIVDTLLVLILPEFFVFSILQNIFSLLNIIPLIMVSLRRLHDINRSGWWLIFTYIPIIGWIFWVFWFCKKGDLVNNTFGVNPLIKI